MSSRDYPVECNKFRRNSSSSLSAINERNRLFWDAQKKIDDRLMKNEALAAIAYKSVKSEGEKRVPFGNLSTFSKALKEAESDRAIFSKEFSRKGGRIPKADSLQRWILKVLAEDPAMSVRGLVRSLTMLTSLNLRLTRNLPS
jgi:hypothetical protein